MTKQELTDLIFKKRSFLCIGLDTDISRIPKHLLQNEDAIFAFNKAIIDATRDLCVAYKLNTAFYEAEGEKGWRAMKKTFAYIGNSHFKIADAKRGDIGNTSQQYAKAFFDDLYADAITLSPYMGKNSVQPFLEYKNKWVIVLALTSNASAQDFQLAEDKNGNYLFAKVLQKAATWGTTDNTMFVAGATQNRQLETVRKAVPNHFLLIPGVGAQGGSIEQTVKYASNNAIGILINSSRQIIYADSGTGFANAAANSAKKLVDTMQIAF